MLSNDTIFVSKPWIDHIPRPRRSLLEWLTLTQVASVRSRWHGVARLEQQFPELFSRPVRRIYQVNYLDEQQRASFTADFLAGKLSSLRQLGKLVEGEDAFGYTVLSELVSVYVLRLADSRWVLVLLPTRTGEARELPLPSYRLLFLLLLSRKIILR